MYFTGGIRYTLLLQKQRGAEMVKWLNKLSPPKSAVARYPNSDLIRKVRCPVLMIHGKSDDMINYRHAEQLFELISTRKLLISPPAMLHNTNLMNDACHGTSLGDFFPWKMPS